jgi:hypothetical protein
LVEQTARGHKRDALTSLRSLLPSGEKHVDRKLEDAIEHLEKSLAPELWVDDSHLTSKGKKVFHEEKKTVDKLRQVKQPPAQAGTAIDALVTADRILALTEISEATAAGGDDRKLADAEKEIEKASREIAKDHPAQAIEHYEHAWKKARQAEASDRGNGLDSFVTLALQPPASASAGEGIQPSPTGRPPSALFFPESWLGARPRVRPDRLTFATSRETSEWSCCRWSIPSGRPGYERRRRSNLRRGGR